MFDRDGFGAWIRDHAAKFEPLDGARVEPEKLAILDDALSRSRIVFLGEQNHFIHEKYDYRLWFLRYLFSRGFRTIGEELSFADGVQIDRYIETGDGSELDRVATYGYRGAWRTDRDDEPTGYLRESWDHYPTALFGEEQLRFAKELRRLSLERKGGSRLRFFGFDVDGLPGLAYQQLDELLAVEGEPGRALRDQLARAPGESLEDEIARLDRVLDGMQAPTARAAGLIARLARTLRESLHYMGMAHPAPTIDALGPALLHRERMMHEHVAWAIDRMGPDEKLVLMAANDHLFPDADRVRRHTSGASPGGEGVPPLGTWVANRHAGEVFSVWFLYERGEDSQPFESLGNQLRSPRGSLNRRLGKAGAAFAFPTRSADPRASQLQSEMQVVSLYNTTYRAVPADQADAICFIREVGPLREATDGSAR